MLEGSSKRPREDSISESDKKIAVQHHRPIQDLAMAFLTLVIGSVPSVVITCLPRGQIVEDARHRELFLLVVRALQLHIKRFDLEIGLVRRARSTIMLPEPRVASATLPNRTMVLGLREWAPVLGLRAWAPVTGLREWAPALLNVMILMDLLRLLVLR